MKHLIFMFLVIGTVMIFFGCQEENTLAPELNQSNQVTNTLEKPMPNLTGVTYCPFTFTPPTFWNGTIDFGAEGIYGLTFISYDPPRAYSQASPFEEDFIIYELGTDWSIPENVYMKGSNAGVVTYANNPLDPAKVVANGQVEEAYGPFVSWQGRRVHMSGAVYWAFDENGDPTGLPERAEGTFRIN